MAKRALKPCGYQGCSKLTRKRRCDEHEHTGWERWQAGRTSTQRGYGATWRRKRGRILARDDYLCQLCIKEGRTTLATEVDHRVPKEHGGTDDDANLWSLCHPHHKRKTATERRRRPGGAW